MAAAAEAPASKPAPARKPAPAKPAPAKPAPAAAAPAAAAVARADDPDAVGSQTESLDFGGFDSSGFLSYLRR